MQTVAGGRPVVVDKMLFIPDSGQGPAMSLPGVPAAAPCVLKIQGFVQPGCVAG
jgi:hypothetical protein